MYVAFDKLKFIQLVNDMEVIKFQKEGKYMLYKINEVLDYEFANYEYVLDDYRLKIFPKLSLLNQIRAELHENINNIPVSYQQGVSDTHIFYKNKPFFKRLKFLVSKK